MPSIGVTQVVSVLTTGLSTDRFNKLNLNRVVTGYALAIYACDFYGLQLWMKERSCSFCRF